MGHKSEYRRKQTKLNPLHHKVARGGKGLEQKKGQRGVVPNYVIRSGALKRLQLSAKDFRRLCILKGIYPRDPSKKVFGKNQTYYHVKDIKFLMHEPLLQKFREQKVFVRKLKKALLKKEKARVTTLQQHSPQITLDHLLRERYPTFIDALNDTDDALSTLFLFRMLPAKLSNQRSYNAKRVQMVTRLCDEWLAYIMHQKGLLRKVFVSVKGFYYQASIPSSTGTPNVNVTWLVPHNFTQYLPDDVDYTVMLTFLQFYETLMRFICFKLYHDCNLQYPPKINRQINEQRQSLLDLLNVRPVEQSQIDSTATQQPTQKKQKLSAADAKKLQSNIANVVRDIAEDDEEEAMDQTDAADTVNTEEEGAAEPTDTEATTKSATDDLSDFHQLGGELSADEQDSIAASKTFADKTFLLSRETPADSLEFVIACGGGRAVRDSVYRSLTAEQQRALKVTHHVVDRPTVPDAGDNDESLVKTRDAVQPQWIYDSFNQRVCLPVSPYVPGQAPPPHLSPFTQADESGYVPKHALVLEQWKRIAQGLPADEQGDDVEPTAVMDEDVDEEEQYVSELAAEKAGKSQTSMDEEKAAATTDQEDDSDNEDIVADSDDEQAAASSDRGKSSAIAGGKTSKPQSKAAPAVEDDLITSVMSNKKKKMLQKIHSKGAKQQNRAALLDSRAKALADKTQKTATSKPKKRKAAAT